MPTLSEKLKAMGVKIGADKVTSIPKKAVGIEVTVPGQEVNTQMGPVFVVDEFFPIDKEYSRACRDNRLRLTASFEGLSRWSSEPIISTVGPQEFAFLDTETSGLAGGTGTYAFMVGAGRFEDESFHLAQFFMRDPSEEPALLLALESFLSSCSVLVTFNGKSFDVPLLNTRFTLQGWSSPIADIPQIDLLHLSRSLWRQRLPSRTLGNLEYEILGIERTSEEVPGWMIPQLYFEYLQSGDAQQMKNVFYHNAMDILSLVALLDHTSHFLANPEKIGEGEDFELLAVAKIYEKLDDINMAIRLYHESLEKNLPKELFLEAVKRLSFLYKRQDLIDEAVSLWETAAMQGDIYAHVELAKVFEHRRNDFEIARKWTQRAIDIINHPDSDKQLKLSWNQELEHRLRRLNNKLSII